MLKPERLTFDIPANPLSDAHQLVCWQWGDVNAKKTIMCVHGLTRNGRDFDILAQALSKKYRVICPDVVGRGESGRLTDTKGYAYPAYGASLGFVLQSLGISKLDWIGTSMGGILGMMTAHFASGIINKLIINDIGCLVPASGLKRIRAYAGSETVFATRDAIETEARRRFLPFGITKEEHWQALLAHSFKERVDGTFEFAYDPNILANLPKTEDLQDVDLWGFWDAVKLIPVMLIRGADSDILPREIAQKMQATHPALNFQEIKGCGHAPALMEDSQVQMIEHWLEQ